MESFVFNKKQQKVKKRVPALEETDLGSSAGSALTS